MEVESVDVEENDVCEERAGAWTSWAGEDEDGDEDEGGGEGGGRG